MRIAVIGAGGVGGYFGGKLAQAGHDVTFVARGRHLAALRERGLIVESSLGDATVRAANFTDDLGQVAPLRRRDALRQAVGRRDHRATTPAVACERWCGDSLPERHRRARDPRPRASSQRVLGGIAYIAATIREPGVIAHTGTMARLVVGVFEGGNGDAAVAFRDACVGARVDAALSADIRRALWEKFCFLSAMSGVTSLARQPIGVIRGDPDLRLVFESAVREAWSVGRARGIALADDYAARQFTFLDALPAQMRSSMLNDLVAGNRLEAPWLSGAVARWRPSRESPRL